MSINNILKTFSLLLLLTINFYSPEEIFAFNISGPGDSIRQNRPWTFGINCGAAFANKYHADFYNGSTGNQNEINYILGNYYHSQEIYNALNDTFSLTGLPADMKYSPAFCVGFYVKKNLNSNFGIFIQFNYSKFVARDVFTLKIGNKPAGYSLTDDLRNYPIWGKEERINIDIGASGEMLFAPKIYGFLEAGFNLNNTRVIENMISIESLEYSIINIYGNQAWVPNTQLQEYYVHEGGIGLGAFLSPGIKFKFNDYLAIDILGSVYWSKINLMYYNKFRPQYNVMLRFCFIGSFSKNDDD